MTNSTQKTINAMPFVDEITADTPISMLTVGQLCEVLGKSIPTQITIQQAAPKNIVRGYDGLARAMEVKRSTVGYWVSSGKIEEATQRDSRKIWFDVDKVREIIGRKSGGRMK